MQKTIGRKKYISGIQAAKIIGVNRATFYLWRKSDKYSDELQPTQFGARDYFPLSEVREFAKAYHPHARIQAAERTHYTPEANAVDRAIAILEAALEELKAGRMRH